MVVHMYLKDGESASVHLLTLRCMRHSVCCDLFVFAHSDAIERSGFCLCRFAL